MFGFGHDMHTHYSRRRWLLKDAKNDWRGFGFTLQIEREIDSCVFKKREKLGILLWKERVLHIGIVI